MAIGERDPHTGHMTTGHEWNGIIELNRPVPKVVWVFLAATVLFSVVYWILMPAWPLIDDYTRGVLGVTQQERLADELREAEAQRADWTEEIAARDYAGIAGDESLMPVVRQTGATLFADNCAVCHGARAQGGDGYPRLTDDAWLWGGEPATIFETLRVGINSGHPETRTAQMPAFGQTGILDAGDISDVVTYVRALSGSEPAVADAAASREAGAEVYAANCVSCHGEDGTGNQQVGAPDLTDDFWIYGGDRESIYATIVDGRAGHMPHWDGRLSDLERKILTLYVRDLGAAER